MQASGNGWAAYNGDSCDLIRQVPDNSIDISVYSPPFSNLYIYSDSVADMGNCVNSDEFLEHYGYLVAELYRVTVPGRLCIVHCKDLPRYRGRDGTAGLNDFPGDLIRCHSKHGWSYHSRCTIWKCPVVEMERTKNNGLLYKTLKRDSSQSRQGMADYVLAFRKPPAGTLMSDKPIARGLEKPTLEVEPVFDKYIGECDPRETDIHPSPYSRDPSADASLAVWQRYAEPVWWDIDQTDVLNTRQAKDSKDERHICPLQLGLVRRCLQLWSNPGDTVLSPFMGIGSEGVVAVEEGRKFIGFELKDVYWQAACKYLRIAEQKMSEPELFGQVEPETEPALA